MASPAGRCRSCTTATEISINLSRKKTTRFVIQANTEFIAFAERDRDVLEPIAIKIAGRDRLGISKRLHRGKQRILLQGKLAA